MQFFGGMLASFALMMSLSAAEISLTPQPEPSPQPQLLVSADPGSRGHGWLSHAFALASLGTTMTLAGGIGTGLLIASTLSATSRRGFDEGGSAMGYLITTPILALGLSMIAFAIPLFVKGFRERLGVSESVLD